jgi:protein-glutamine gamma-glutamyltransferase
MRFGLVHRVMTDALAALGVLAVVSTASLNPWTNVLLVFGLASAIAIPDAWQSKAALRHFATIAPIALFVLQALRLVAGRPALDVAVEFAALLQVIRLATRRGAAHDQQIIVLALLHLVAGTVLGGGLMYGLCFFGFLVVAPGALVLSHLRREVEGNYRQGARDRTGLPVDVPRILRSRRVVGRGFLAATCLLSVPILIFTAALFVLFPRVGLSLLLLNHPRQGRMVGFSDRVDLGQHGVLRSDPSIALRFDVANLPDPPPPRMTLRLRGTAFDTYDGGAWSRTLQERSRVERTPGSELYSLYRNADTFRDRTVSFDLEPIDPPVIFLPPRAVAIRVRTPNQTLLSEPLSIQRGPEGEFRYAGSDARGLRYEVFLAREDEAFVEQMSGADRARYVSVPPSLPSRVAALARSWTEGLTTESAKARIIEDHLRKDFKYDLGSPSGGTPQPLDHFLFESKRGHCEFFSTAMAIMLRTVGIPSRNVTGFVGGTYNRFGHFYAVREGDAHSWVEAYIDDPQRPGWQTFDPTPPAGAQPLEQTTGALVYLRDIVEALSQRWNRYVIGYDLRTQVRLFEDFARSYDHFRMRQGLDRGYLDHLTRAPVIAAGVLTASCAGYFAWKRRRRVPLDHRQATPSHKQIDKRLESAAVLYRALESALLLHGVARPASLPPLRHAEVLKSKDHPLGAEIHSLTEIYIATRFGGEMLTDLLKRDFEKRIHEIKIQRPPVRPHVASTFTANG